jgi:NAD(P)H-hydrate epimerase
MRPPLPPLEGSVPPAYPAHRPVSAAASRALDLAAGERHGVPSIVLMEHAARGVAEVAVRLWRAARAAGGAGGLVVLAGPGNNGGDGFGAARCLASWGLPVRLLLCAPGLPRAGDAALEARWLAGQPVPEAVWEAPEAVRAALAGADVAVDALFGVGLSRPLGAPYRDWIEALNQADLLRLAVDVPSGLDADSGEPLPVAVRADVTATMAAPKAGLLGRGAVYAGRVVEVDIGLPAPLHRRLLLEP